MSVDTNFGTILGVNYLAIEGENKERGNSLKIDSHANISNSDSTVNNISETSLSSKLQKLLTVIYDTSVSNPEIRSCYISFKSPSLKTSRWAGAILDEFGVYSRAGEKVKQTRKLVETNYPDQFVFRSINAINEQKTGSAVKRIIEKPVFGLSGTITIKGSLKVVINTLIVNESDKRAVLAMLAVFQDIEDEMVEYLRASPLVEIVRGYCDWTDTGLEIRQKINEQVLAFWDMV